MKQNELLRRRRYRRTAMQLERNQLHARRGTRLNDRRGVLLLVVLSVLILFMLLGTTFLLTSNQYQNAAKIMDKANRTTFQPEDVLERALMQLVRDTNNRHSALRYHSLLRDLYGGDGFIGHVNTVDALPRFAGVTSTDTDPLGTTAGELVDIFVTDAGDDFLEANHVIGLDLDSNGLPVGYPLSSNSAYYNGCLLTMMEGPCRGQSVRIVDYDYDPSSGTNGLGRLRVVVPQRINGQALSVNRNNPGDPDYNALLDFYDANSGSGYRFMVNGRPFNGTGVGYNTLADTGAARLTTYEAMNFTTVPVFGEVSLFPNSTYFTPSYLSAGNLFNNLFYAETADLSANLTADRTDDLSSTFSLYAPNGGYQGPGDTDESYDAPDFQNMFLAHQALTSRFRGRLVNSSGASVDPAAYSDGDAPQRIDLDGVTIPSLHRPALANFWFHRLYNSQWLIDAVNDPQERIGTILAPFDFAGSATLDVRNQIAAIKRKFSMRPLRDDHPNFNGSNPFSENSLAASAITNDAFLNINNEITAPIWETIGPWDVDNDGDGIPDSVWVDLGLPVQKTEDGRFYKPLVAMLVEDLDGRLNLNAHGSAEHFANSQLDQSSSTIAGNLAQDYNNVRSLQTSNQLPQGTGWGPADITLRSVLSPDLPLYDFANGSSISGFSQYDDYARLTQGRPSPEDLGRNVSSAVNLAVDFGRYGSVAATGPDADDVSLFRPGKSATLNDGAFNGISGREQRVPYDFAGYPQFAGELFSASAFGERPDLRSRYATALSATGTPVVEAGTDARADINFDGIANFPILDDSPYEIDLSSGARRGVPADLEAIVDSYVTANPINEDALFSVAELERILRATDVDAGELPDRLWNLVDAFDPEKLAVQQAIVSGDIPFASIDNFSGFNPDTLQRVIAQSQAAINRRLVTTDSYDLPVPNENWTSRLLLGADGVPGVPQLDTTGDGNLNSGDDNNNGIFDDGAELGIGFYDSTDGTPTNDSDDYQVIMGTLPPSGARITDYLRYRVTLELLRNGTIFATSDPLRINALVNQIIYGNDQLDALEVRNDLYTFGGMLAPEVLAGHKMNLNRPLGDGRDNNGNGVVDEPAEVGDTYTYAPNTATITALSLQDMNGDGLFNQGSISTNLYYDQTGDGQPDTFDSANFINQDRDLNGMIDAYEYPEPIVDYTWIDEDSDGVRDLNECHPFVHSQGRDINGRGAIANGFLVADDAPLARQYLARHLYCLMLTMMDENYIAPYDSNDPQVLHYIDPDSQGSVANQIKESLKNNPPINYPWPGFETIPVAGTPDEIDAAHGLNAKRIALRKLTCRQIAQWAINCVDIRDPDSIQTPFEYDENPWDGWNVVSNYNDGSIVVYPLDGDLTTDENYGMYRDLSSGTLSDPLPTTFTPDAVPAYYQTRGVVWGAERPELLLNEGIAWHDRRLEDADLPESDYDDNGVVTGVAQEIIDEEKDNDLDQIMKPSGRCYVELFNPWSSDSLLAAELYRDRGNVFRRYDSDGDGTIILRGANDDYDSTLPYDPGDEIVEGLLLDRVSDAVSAAGLPSPVWRMACTETHPMIRNVTVPSTSTIEVNDDPIIEGTTGYGNGGNYIGLTIENSPWAYASLTGITYGSGADRGRIDPLPEAYLQYFQDKFDMGNDIMGRGGNQNSALEIVPRITDPDFPTFDRLAQPKDIAGTQVTISNQGLGIGGKVDRRILEKPIDYLERLFYFTGAPSVDEISKIGAVRDGAAQSGLHIPELFYDVNVPSATLNNLRRELLNNDNINLENNGMEITASGDSIRVHISRFVALDYFDTDGDHPTDEHDTIRGPLEPIPLAPILPGRYAVVGTAGEVYGKSGTTYDANSYNNLQYDNLQDRYTSVVTETLAAIGSSADDRQVQFRRIEMFPSTDPNRHQFSFRMNGGLSNFEGAAEYPRISEVVDLTPNDPLDNVDDGMSNDGYLEGAYSNIPVMVNLTDPVLFSNALPDGTGKPISPVIQPVVGIPMEGFTISEPLDGYFIRQLELDPSIDQYYLKDPRILNTQEFPPEGLFKSGNLQPAGFDEPFDLLPELIENQTTPNYRTMHLQRLANPLLAWNPPLVSGSGELNPQHDPDRPVNPYLTTDSLSLDLTSLNSRSNAENILAATALNQGTVDGPEVRHEVNRNLVPNATIGGKAPLRPNTLLTLQSQERGLHGNVPVTGDSLPSRTLWNQDRPTGASEILYDSGVALEPIYKISPRESEYSFGSEKDWHSLYYREGIFDYPVRHSLGFANRGFGKFYDFENLTYQANDVDLNGDGTSGELIGSLEIDNDNVDLSGENIGSDDVTTPVFHWPNRPYISEAEVMLTPIWGSSRMLTYYSIYNPALSEQPNQYDGSALIGPDTLDNDGDGNFTEIVNLPLRQISIADAKVTNDERWDRMHTTYGHLPNFFATAGEASKVAVNADDEIVAYGAPHFYRILDYLHVPSRFIATDRLLTPERFTTIPTNLNDPRRELAAPFNRVDHYREPGKVNLNTVVGRGDDTLVEDPNTNGLVLDDPADRWSEVYDGLMHRRQDANILSGNNLIAMGHLGPAWRDIEKSRRGYLDSSFNLSTGVLNHSPLALNPSFPTFFANPFRSAGEGSNVPLSAMQQPNISASMLRAHHISPGSDSAWGNRQEDYSTALKIWGSGDQVFDDASEAYAGIGNAVTTDDSDDSVIFNNTSGTIPRLFYNPRVNPITDIDLLETEDSIIQPRIPLMSGAALEPSLDTERNPHLRYQPMTRLANLTSTRSGVFAVWLTVGFFEVTPATENQTILNRYFEGGDIDQGFNTTITNAEDLFFRIYPDGYTLGEEIGLATGDNQRHRGFYIVDRTLPVAFKPGEDLNVDKAVLLRRRIE